jgi:hypothetical protein
VRKCASSTPPNGGDLRTLRDAGNFIAGLSKRQHETFAWGETAPTPRKRARKYRIVR